MKINNTDVDLYSEVYAQLVDNGYANVIIVAYPPHPTQYKTTLDYSIFNPIHESINPVRSAIFSSLTDTL